MRHLNWQIRLVKGLVLSGMLLGWADSALAQRRPIADETLGDERSIVTPQDNIRGVPGDRIEGGARRGNNLFHSFREFNVDAGRAVYFADPGVQNILGRVTGGTASEILGRLGVLGNANLFLINPSGIIFGEGASLDVGGSFAATTADAVQFGEQGFFSATDPTAPPLLTVQPSAFLFNRLNPAPIANSSKVPATENRTGVPAFGLQVPAGESLALLGGNVSLNGGGLVALGGRVEVGGLSQSGTVTYNADRSLGFPIGVARSDVALTNRSRINSVGDGGSITVNAGALEIINSVLSAGIGRNSGFVGAQAGDITLNASDIRGRNEASIANSVRVGGVGNGGDIRITTDSFSLTNGAQLNASTSGKGNAGSVMITADDRVFLDGVSDNGFSSTAASSIEAGGIGSGGDITIDTGSLVVRNGAALTASTNGQGNAGSVMITADQVVFDGSDNGFSSVAFSNVREGGVGSGGNITIDTGSLIVRNGAGLTADTSGQGNAGSVIITADQVVFDGVGANRSSAAFSNVREGGVGSGGNITIDTGSLVVRNGAQLAANTSGQGRAGSVIITAANRVVFDDGTAFSSVEAGGVGSGGNITIDTGSLVVRNGAELIASTEGQGNAGSVMITAADRVALNNSDIFSRVGGVNVNRVAVGNGGDIRIDTSSLSLTNGATLVASTLGQGNAGNVIINARDRVSLEGVNPTNPKVRSSIFSSVGGVNVNRVAVGNSGDIRIDTGFLSLTNGAQLSASTLGQGNAGNVIIHARDRVSLDGASPTNFEFRSAIFSSVEATNANTVAVGDGGDIRITTESLSLTNGAALQASTRGQGRGGDVIIVADSIRLADRGSILTSTQSRFPGGTVILNANSFEATGGSQINTATNSTGQAGNIIFNVVDRITLSGVTNRPISEQGAASGLYASTARGSMAPGGTIQITTGELQVLDRARIAVDSQGSGIGGDIDITASRVQLDDRARITAETVANNGGNIRLRDVELLRLGNNSRITTSAGTDRAGGNGGNININANFIVALPNENSDIRANAFTGRGGNVDITTEGLFGIAAQTQDNPLTSDITASSERGVQGTVDITPPDVDPRRGLTELPVAVVDASDQIAQTCSAQAGAGEFVVTGRGGLPPSPIDSLIGDESLADWAVLERTEVKDGETSAIAPLPQADRAAGAIVEAQGWVVGEDGNVKLVAAAPASSIQPPAICQSSENP